MTVAARARFAPALALFLVVLGGRLWLIDRAGSDLPLWDQWWGDFVTVVAPVADGRFQIESLTRPHNEHRLLYPRLGTLALLKLSGRWEPREALVVSALTRAIGLTVVFLVLGAGQSRKTRVTLLCLLAALGALPVGVFNLLSGFQLPFFLGEPVAVLILMLLFRGGLTSGRVALAMCLLFLALLNLASVVITSLGAATVLGLQAVLRRGPIRKAVAVAFVLCAFSVFAILTTPSPSTSYRARDIAEFARVFMQLAAWPFPEVPILGLLALVPPFLLLHRLVTDREAPESSWFAFALCVTSWAQQAAIALMRGSFGSITFPQYVDGLWLTHLSGGLALVEALRPRPGKPPGSEEKVLRLWTVWLVALISADVALRGAPGLESVRRAVEIRQPAFAAALQTGHLEAFGAEAQQVIQMELDKDYSFFDHPVGRFAVPGVVYLRLRNEPEKFLEILPASLVGAPPSLVSRAMRVLTRLSPLFFFLGLMLMVQTFGFRLEGKDRNGAEPASAG